MADPGAQTSLHPPVCREKSGGEVVAGNVTKSPGCGCHSGGYQTITRVGIHPGVSESDAPEAWMAQRDTRD